MSLQADIERGRWKNRDPRRNPLGPVVASGINSAASRVKFTLRWYGCCSERGVLTDSEEDCDCDRDWGPDDEHVSSDIPNVL